MKLTLTVPDNLASEFHLSPEEEGWWEQYQYIEHLARIAKAKAVTKLEAT